MIHITFYSESQGINVRNMVAGTQWDDPLLDETNRKVQMWFGELGGLQRIKVPRSLQRRDAVKSTSLHTFVAKCIWRSGICQD